MRLQWALDNLRFLVERIPPRHWGEGGGISDDEPKRCNHVLSREFVVCGRTGQLKRNKHGDAIVHVRRCRNLAQLGHEACRLHGGPAAVRTGRKGGVSDPMWLVVLAADINREIDDLPPRLRRLFHLMYRAQVPCSVNENGTPNLHDWYAEGHHDRYVDGVKRQLGYTEPAVFTAEHDSVVAEIERRLIHHFPEARHAA